MKTVVGVFDTEEQARQAIEALQAAGFRNERMSVLGRQRPPEQAIDDPDKPTREVAGKAGVGALGGGMAGGLAGLLVGLGLIALPGIGPVVAAGTLAAALGSTAVGAGIGATTGGLLGALVATGMDKEDAETYAEAVRRGGVIVLVEAPEEITEVAENLLDQAGAINVDARRQQWLEDGWTHFDEKVIPPQNFPGGINYLSK